jgi:UPF0755 protein
VSQPTNRNRNAKQTRAATRRKRIARGIAGLSIVILIVAVGVAPLFRPVSSERHPVKIRVPNGAGVGRIGAILESEGVIRSATAFDWYVRWRGVGAKLKAGRYTLSGDMTLRQITRELVLGPLRADDGLIRVTIPEGYTLRQIADTLDEKGVTDGKAFLQLATDPDAIADAPADFPLPKQTLEGYLFPDTYAFPPHTPPARVIDAMLLNFYGRFARPYQQEIAASGRSLQRLATEASLVEREAKAPQDRARIAGVIDNRLQRGMKLQVDATVLYALGHHKDQVLTRDLEVDSPYNTYRHGGLPPGPIANPGLASLLAALRPEKHDFLYYVARPDGTHIFTRTRAEHETARRQARLERQRETHVEEQPGG